jgi:hypothetical protein
MRAVGNDQSASAQIGMWWIFGVAVVLLIVTLVGLVIWTRQEPATSPSDAWYATEDAQVWDEKLRDVGDDFGLASVRGVATAWGASITALLGVFTGVAILKGPDSVTTIGGWQAQVAAWLILGAAAVALVAVLLCALAAQGVPRWRDDLDAWTYRDSVRRRAMRATTQLEWSRYLVVFVLLLVFIAMGITWLTAAASAREKAPQNAIVVTTTGVECGIALTKDGFVTLQVDGAARRLKDVKAVQLVDKCP